ncbi:hypothetical protein SYNTR_1831 [Candidatus Syntrophocurvum alkaliphilum]|uniref:Uncharacterized protein n=1 Tax=Candidatus Syntrophocurvum alkaliphilum TaxID=2293317 RepID=A0A6I6DCP0_9FIRM|nr:hypothetical protein [Candidatus Syntrophocurvum alkaliphilum]QGU00425.1 hypothetical protein SYNTR_1831 [Candidatus Syntrophocurvum alkaliphilum]
MEKELTDNILISLNTMEEAVEYLREKLSDEIAPQNGSIDT